ncbi:MAG: YfhO family protein [Clostridiales bacterium]|nr:YfhO family protein [Clostridiales bacterium]
MQNHENKKLSNKSWLPYLLAFLIPFAVCLIICAGNGVYPFGENCILHVDMYHQYCPFFTEFLNKLRSGDSLLYSWNLGLGTDFVSLFAYYLASPLNWLIVLCPKAYVIEFMTILVLIKIGLCSLAFFIFLKAHFHLTGKDGKFHVSTLYPAILFSCAYALSGFIAAYYWDIMWLDCVALFPIIMLGLERLVKDGKPLLYYISLGACIFSNYYISIPICITLFIYFIYLFLSQKKGIKTLGKFALFSGLAGGSSAVLLLPEIAILGTSGSAGDSFPQQVKWYFNIIAEFGRGATAASAYTGDDHWPNLYAGAFALVLMWMFFLNRRIKKKEKIACGIMVAFFLVSFAENQLDFVWHGFHFPQSLPGRQSFIYIFLILVMGFAVIRKWKGVRQWHIIFSCAVALILLIASTVLGDSSVTETYAIAFTVLLICAYGLIMYLIKAPMLVGMGRAENLRNGRRQMPIARTLGVIALAIAGAELVLNMAATGFSVTSRTSYTDEEDDYSALLARAEEDAAEDGCDIFYRVEDTSRKTKNDDALYGYASATIFSSLMNLDVSELYQSLYMEGGKNFYSYNGSTPLTSAMLSVRYMLSSNPCEEDEFHTLIGQAGGSYLYENNYCLPLGYMVDESAIDEWEPSTSDRISSLNSLAKALGAEGSLLSYASCDIDAEEGVTTVTVQDDGFYYAAYVSCGEDSLTVSHTDGWSQRYSKTTHRYLISLGSCKAGEQVSIKNSGGEAIDFYVYRLSTDALDSAYATLSQQTMDLTEMTSTRVVGHIDVRSEGRLILSIPADAGWTLYVDGVKTDIDPWQDALIGVHLTEGEHEIRLVYVTPGLRLGALISIVCVAIAAGIGLLFHKKDTLRSDGTVL